MIPLTETEIERELFDLHLLPTFVAEPEAPLVPTASEVTGSAALSWSGRPCELPAPGTDDPAAPIMEPPARVVDASAARVAPPPPFYRALGRTRTYECIVQHDATTANRMTRWPTWSWKMWRSLSVATWLDAYGITPSRSGHVMLFKGTLRGGMSPHGALYRPGCITEVVSGKRGLYFAPTRGLAEEWVRAGWTIQHDVRVDVYPVIVAVADLSLDGSPTTRKICAQRCYVLAP